MYVCLFLKILQIDRKLKEFGKTNQSRLIKITKAIKVENVYNIKF